MQLGLPALTLKVKDQDAEDQRATYVRELLLGDAKRNAVLDLWEVERYGTESFGDPAYVSIYGMRPADWYAKGVRVLGRTAVECTRDALGDLIGKDVAASVGTASRAGGVLVVDLFAGSGNTLYWLAHHLPGARALGFELDAQVFELTRRNVAALGLPIEISNGDYKAGLSGLTTTAEQTLVAFIAPPWGDAFDTTQGLDLRRTAPPITEIVDFLRATFRRHRLLCAIQVYEKVEPDSLAELQSRFDASDLRIYGLNAPGQNHGILLGRIGV